MDVRVVIMDYLADIKYLRKNTQVGYRQRLTVFVTWCSLQGVSLEQVNNRNVQAFLEWLKTNHKPHRTTKGYLSTHTTAG
jgi:site-specific recombinase XerD